MKTTTKVLHSVWAGLFVSPAVALLFSRFRDDPNLVAISIACLSWLPFAIGLIFDRAWAWYGSFVFSVLSVFPCFYLLLWDVLGMAHSLGEGETLRLNALFDPYGGSVLFACVIALAVVAALLRTRHQLLGTNDRVS
jgi:hypothetical protein